MIGNPLAKRISITSTKHVIFGSSSSPFSSFSGSGRGRGGSIFGSRPIDFSSPGKPDTNESKSETTAPPSQPAGTGHGRGSSFSGPRRFEFSAPGNTNSSNSESKSPEQPVQPRGTGHGRGASVSRPRQFDFTATGKPEPNDSKSESPDPPQQRTVIGQGRGKSAILPPFSSFVSQAKPSQSSTGNGRGRGQLPSAVEIGVGRGQPPSAVEIGVGRGQPDEPVAAPTPKVKEENRHIRARPTSKPETIPSGEESEPAMPKFSREEAIRRAVSILSKDDGDGGGGRGRGRGIAGRERGRGRGRFEQRGRTEDTEDGYVGLHLGDNAAGEKLAESLGVEKMNKLTEAFEEASEMALPSPLQDAMLDAWDVNYKIECEPEYLMGEFDQNPDIDEKPPLPLRDVLEKVKPFIVAYEGIQSQEEWEEVVEETMKKVPLLKEIVDYYSGPDRVTAKKQQEELQRVAKTIPASAPASVKRFADRAVLSLQSNPGWGFDRKSQFMDKLVREVNQCCK